MTKFNKHKQSAAKLLCFALLLTSLFAASLKLINAQKVELGISPPITEVIIAPGKKFTQRYIVSNFSESDIVLTPLIFKLTAKDEFGTADIANEPETQGPFFNFFSIAQGKLDGGKLIKIGKDQTIELPLTITIPEGSQEIDYYASFVLQSTSSLQNLGSGQITNAGIATNLLISVSKSGLPQKNASVIEFSAPKIIDSFFSIPYQIRIKNTGNSFFKPIGDIETKGLFVNQRLNIAPQNILSGTVRQVKCVKNEELVECKTDSQFLLGKYTHNLVFTLDEEGKQVSADTETIALPFGLIFALFVPFFIFKFIYAKYRNNNENSHK